jgi:transcription-repair coupling factor (superfamily II helicase)
MELPKLVPRQTFHPAPPAGSADALLLARLASAKRPAGKPTAIVTADATDAQRLIDEMAVFCARAALRAVSRLGNPALRHLLAAPGPDQRAAGHAVAHLSQATGADVVLVPATTALYRLAPPAFLAGYTFHFKVKQKLDEASSRPSSRWRATAMSRRWSAPANTRCAAG